MLLLFILYTKNLCITLIILVYTYKIEIDENRISVKNKLYICYFFESS